MEITQTVRRVAGYGTVTLVAATPADVVAAVSQPYSEVAIHNLTGATLYVALRNAGDSSGIAAVDDTTAILRIADGQSDTFNVDTGLAIVCYSAAGGDVNYEVYAQ